MGWVLSDILILFWVVLTLLILAAVFAPLESLGWWAGWSGKKVTPEDLLEVKNIIPQTQLENVKKYYIVYLSGIGVATADGLATDEVDFITMLNDAMPEAEVITDVFPYSVTNNPLTGQRILTPLWKWVYTLQQKNPNSLIAMMTINIRNILQVFVSSDPRYGPIYNVGVAEEIARSLIRHNYPIGTNKPLFLIGFSGGGQISIGATPYLSPMIGGPVYVVTVGGFLSDDPGIQQVAHLFHNFGDNDPLQAMGAFLWVGRWPIMLKSPWNQMFAKEHITMRCMGPMAHNGKGGYYDVHVNLPDGRNYCKATVDRVIETIVNEGSRI